MQEATNDISHIKRTRERRNNRKLPIRDTATTRRYNTTAQSRGSPTCAPSHHLNASTRICRPIPTVETLRLVSAAPTTITTPIVGYTYKNQLAPVQERSHQSHYRCWARQRHVQSKRFQAARRSASRRSRTVPSLLVNCIHLLAPLRVAFNRSRPWAAAAL